MMIAETWLFQICGPDIVGRKIVVVGESTDSSCLADDCHDADALLHAASCYVKPLSLTILDLLEEISMLANLG